MTTPAPGPARAWTGHSAWRRSRRWELFEELYETQNNQPMSQEQRDFAQRLIEQLREEDA